MSGERWIFWGNMEPIPVTRELLTRAHSIEYGATFRGEEVLRIDGQLTFGSREFVPEAPHSAR